MSDYLSQYADTGLYTMQGRLTAPEQGRFQSFPREGWQKEIERASTAGLRGIEWIYDLYGEGANPLETPTGREQMGELLTLHGVSVVSVCADYFMDCPLLRCSETHRQERLDRLQWLLGVCAQMSISRVVLPFVDASRMRDDDERDQVVQALGQVLPVAEKYGVELHLETDLGPQAFAELLECLEHPLVKVNYDSGNSASLGYRPADEFSAYGARVGSFHIKDRMLGGGTVPLGQGDTDFPALREQLIVHGYRGDFVLQVARGVTDDEVRWLSDAAALAAAWLRGEALNERIEP
ncbi:sugar phosphate isomerase/epimerase family protein [Pseudomonas sp. REB1044]|uniref:sugar phosphate isomerase/epimerase family protein n=1 Tax=Pseudomonas sp. REB1044 TaxID=2675224 RepID=UPI00315D7D8A